VIRRRVRADDRPKARHPGRHDRLRDHDDGVRQRVGLDRREDEDVYGQAVAVARLAIRGCVMMMTILVARRVRVKHTMPMRVGRVVRGALLCGMKVSVRGRGETDDDGQRRRTGQ